MRDLVSFVPILESLEHSIPQKNNDKLQKRVISGHDIWHMVQKACVLFLLFKRMDNILDFCSFLWSQLFARLRKWPPKYVNFIIFYTNFYFWEVIAQNPLCEQIENYSNYSPSGLFSPGIKNNWWTVSVFCILRPKKSSEFDKNR